MRATPVAVLSLLGAFAVFVQTGAFAQSGSPAGTWPDRPIHFIVPFGAGSSSDIVARVVAQKLSERLGQAFVVENRGGASGNIGNETLSRSKPDGYTLGVINTSATVAPSAMAKPTYDPVKDLAPVSMIGASPFVLAATPKLPARTVQELIALAKAKPGAFSYAQAGPATLAGLAGALFTKMAGINLNSISYRGTEQEILDVIEGRVDMQFATIPPTLSLLHDGKLRALGVTGAKRSPALPDVPTIAESGLPGYDAVLWQAVCGPAGIPEVILQRLNSETNAILRDRDTIEALAKLGVDVTPSTQQELGDRIAADVKKWHEVIVAAGITPQ